MGGIRFFACRLGRPFARLFARDKADRLVERACLRRGLGIECPLQQIVQALEFLQRLHALIAVRQCAHQDARGAFMGGIERDQSARNRFPLARLRIRLADLLEPALQELAQAFGEVGAFAQQPLIEGRAHVAQILQQLAPAKLCQRAADVVCSRLLRKQCEDIDPARAGVKPNPIAGGEQEFVGKRAKRGSQFAEGLTETLESLVLRNAVPQQRRKMRARYRRASRETQIGEHRARLVSVRQDVGMPNRGCTHGAEKVDAHDWRRGVTARIVRWPSR